MAGLDTLDISLFDSPVKTKLYRMMYNLLNESERGDAFLSISMMSEADVIKAIRTFPEGIPRVVGK